jgi:hypothetical protein
MTGAAVATSPPRLLVDERSAAVWTVDGMMPVLGWRLHYGDGSIFTHLDGAWEVAPSENVQILEYLHEAPYRTLAYGHDEYRLTPDSAVKFGNWMDLAAFEAMVERVSRG